VPTLIIVTSHIGFGAPHKQDTRAEHGEALAKRRYALPSASYGWQEDAHFLVLAASASSQTHTLSASGGARAKSGTILFTAYRKPISRAGQPDCADAQKWELPTEWTWELPAFRPMAMASLTRDS